MRKIYWRPHREMPEEIYNSFTILLDEIEAAYPWVEDNNLQIIRLKETLEKATKTLKEIRE